MSASALIREGKWRPHHIASAQSPQRYHAGVATGGRSPDHPLSPEVNTMDTASMRGGLMPSVSASFAARRGPYQPPTTHTERDEDGIDDADCFDDPWHSSRVASLLRPSSVPQQQRIADPPSAAGSASAPSNQPGGEPVVLAKPQTASAVAGHPSRPELLSVSSEASSTVDRNRKSVSRHQRVSSSSSGVDAPPSDNPFLSYRGALHSANTSRAEDQFSDVDDEFASHPLGQGQHLGSRSPYGSAARELPQPAVTPRSWQTPASHGKPPAGSHPETTIEISPVVRAAGDERSRLFDTPSSAVGGGADGEASPYRRGAANESMSQRVDAELREHTRLRSSNQDAAAANFGGASVNADQLIARLSRTANDVEDTLRSVRMLRKGNSTPTGSQGRPSARRDDEDSGSRGQQTGRMMAPRRSPSTDNFDTHPEAPVPQDTTTRRASGGADLHADVATLSAELGGARRLLSEHQMFIESMHAALKSEQQFRESVQAQVTAQGEEIDVLRRQVRKLTASSNGIVTDSAVASAAKRPSTASVHSRSSNVISSTVPATVPEKTTANGIHDTLPIPRHPVSGGSSRSGSIVIETPRSGQMTPIHTPATAPPQLMDELVASPGHQDPRRMP